MTTTGSPMLVELPTEIWMVIVRKAVTVFPRTSFNPMQDNKRCVEGFKGACKQFSEVVENVLHENQVLKDYDYFVFLDKPCHAVHSMRVNEPPRPRYLFTNTFYDSLSDYVGITSLSLCTPEPKFTCSRFPSLSFAATLKRLDLRSIRRHDKMFWETVTLELPQLRELRLGATEYLRSERMASIFRLANREASREHVYTNLSDFASGLGSRLSGCPNLRLLSLHLMLTSSATPESKQNFFNKEETIRSEDAAALILAWSLPKLQEVVWSNPWVDEVYGEKNASCRIVRHRPEGDVLGEEERLAVVRDGEAYTGLCTPPATSSFDIARGATCGATWLL